VRCVLGKRWIWLLLAVFSFAPLWAAESDEADDEIVLDVQAPGAEDNEEEGEELLSETDRSFGGWIDLRPSWNPEGKSSHAENEVGVEYLLIPDRSVGYTQEFRMDFEPSGNFQLADGYLWSELSHFVDFTPTLSLSYEPRVYLPTSAFDKQAGLIASTRQYLKLHWQISETFALFLWEVPILAVHTQPGYEEDEEIISNRYFENRIEFGPQVSLFQERITLKVPLVLQSLRHHDFNEDALYNATWTHELWVYPSVMGKLTDTTFLGAAYYSDNFLQANGFYDWDIGRGLKRGIFQIVLQQFI